MAARILIVDDDRATLSGLASLVEQHGYPTLTALDYHEGRHMLLHQAVDLLIVDVRLGAFNGLQLVVLAHSLQPPLPAIVTSGYDDHVLEEDARKMNAPFLLKPVDPPGLLKLIGELIVARN